MNDAHHPLNALPQGHRLQEYELVRVLGFGGFGMTYLGFDHNLDKAVAIKEYLPADIATRTGDNSVAPQASQFRDDFEWGLGRFLDEARTLARFDHRHIIKVFRFFEAHGTAYIVMEYAEGETLSAFLKRRWTLREAELKAILYPVLDGLDVVHRADFLHRDIKPGNIIIRDEDNSPVLLDFGAARQAIGAKSRSVTSIITPGYAPIEQYSSRGDQGPWTDIYALGAVCYRALTGQVPDDATERVIQDPLIPVSERCAGQASAGFLSAIDKALQMDKAARPQSVASWRTALSGETSGSVNIPPPVTASAQERERVDAPPVHQRDDARLPLFARGLVTTFAQERERVDAPPVHQRDDARLPLFARGLVTTFAQERERVDAPPVHQRDDARLPLFARGLVTTFAQERERVDAPPVHQRDDARSGSPKKRKGKLLAAVIVALLFVGVVGKFYVEYVEDQRQELAAEQAEDQREEQAALEKQRQEQAALEKQRQEQAALEKQRQEQAALEKQRQEQAALEKQRQEQAALEKQRQEQAALEKQRQEQAALEKQRQEQAALEKQRQEEVLEFWKVEEKPVAIKKVKPVYPDLARKAGLEGKVFLRFQVGRDGRVSRIQVLKGQEIFRQAAIDAVAQSLFKPAMQNDKPVRVWMTQMIKFTLNN